LRSVTTIRFLSGLSEPTLKDPSVAVYTVPAMNPLVVLRTQSRKHSSADKNASHLYVPRGAQPAHQWRRNPQGWGKFRSAPGPCGSGGRSLSADAHRPANWRDAADKPATLIGSVCL